MFVLKKWVRAALILKARVDKKQKHTHICRQFCMEVAFKLQARKGEFQVLDSKKKRNFQWVLLHSIYTDTQKHAKLFGQDDGEFFFKADILADVNKKHTKKNN